MSIKTRSFDASPMYAFAESKVKARNPVKKPSVTPIIIITPTIRQVPKKQWNYHDEWLPSESLVGPSRYDNNPDLWHQDIKELIESISNAENRDWGAQGLIKPNYVIWLWQPIHVALSHIDVTYLSALTGTPLRPKNATALTSINITSTRLLTGTGKSVPGFVESVRQFSIGTEPLLLRQTGYTGTPVLATLPVPFGIEIAMRMTQVGEIYQPGLNYYWLPQPSLGQLFLESMEDRPLDCVQEDPLPTTRNRRVHVSLIENPGLERFIDPLEQETPRRPGEKTPIEKLIATIEQYRSAKDVGIPDPCGGDGRVEVSYRKLKGSQTWVSETGGLLGGALL